VTSGLNQAVFRWYWFCTNYWSKIERFDCQRLKRTRGSMISLCLNPLLIAC